MDLSFGTNVREHGYRIGRLAGIEVNRQTRGVRNIIFSGDGTIGHTAEKRPLEAVPPNHFDGDILLNPFLDEAEPVTPGEMLVLSDATRVMRGGRQIGRLSGVEVSPETGEIVTIAGRQHWWTRRFHLKPSELDFSVPGEIRVVVTTSKAA